MNKLFRITRRSISGRINYSEQRGFPIMRDDMLKPDTFKEKTALVTGGGTGLGYGMSLKISSRGGRVVIASRKIDLLKKAAEEIQILTGNEVIPLELDVKDPSSVKNVADFMESELKQLPDIIINNAAGNFISPTEYLSPNAFKTVVDIVLMGTVYVVLEFGKRLIASGKTANFLAITTTYTDHGSGFVVPSACAKSGVQALTESLAAEWGRYGLRFNAIAPGPIYTEGAFSRLDPSGKFVEEYLKDNPSGRLGTLEEIANLATYLVSDYAGWISGETVKLDGGAQSYRSGEFNLLTKVSKDQWKELQKIARSKK
ncbi:2,4-dienoyl-CoA reductase, mitochondrial-like [Oopsacas minuta]|uniref:2,4-dienoyl-CoA reductase, mitochondrial-like n=1 Tax=Oopsacas minuta TaxID=111878 RepID=A0AAV7JUE4_9METZ|nr:2,4-dienoyl-CoA reductase, mitochondrial-like [Oopsacas minuta]